MKGLVAKLPFPPARRLAGRLTRAAAVLLCSVLSVSLVGAVHTVRFDTPRAAERPAAKPEPALAALRVPTQQRLSIAPTPLPPVAKVSAKARDGQTLQNDAQAVAASISSHLEKMLTPPALRLPAAPPAPSLSPGAGQTVRWMEVTAYCPCRKCCGPLAQGITASGRHVSFNGGRFVAADRALPFNTKLSIPGYNDGQPVPVLDRGGAIKGDKLDVYFPTHHEARQWGRKRIPVSVLNG